MRICYVEKRFGDARLGIIERANAIIEDYQEQGFKLTLRQLYYQFVARGHIANSQREYKNLQTIINAGRLAGEIDWDAIEDRTRNIRIQPHWSSPSSIVEACADQYTEDKWLLQDYRPQVWIEKDALVGVIEGACEELDVPCLSCRGYVSQSEMWAAGRRIKRQFTAGHKPVIIHLGDHDPSGIDMTRNIHDRLSMFAEEDVEVKRIALTMEQVEEYSPPPNPAKTTDARYQDYSEQYGEESWELDALEPSVLDRLVRDTVLEYRDEDLWDRAVKKELKGRRQLRQVAASLHS